MVRVTDIETTIGAICDGKAARDVKTGSRARAIVRGGDAAASRAVRDPSAVFSFAIRRELVGTTRHHRWRRRRSDGERGFCRKTSC